MYWIKYIHVLYFKVLSLKLAFSLVVLHSLAQGLWSKLWFLFEQQGCGSGSGRIRTFLVGTGAGSGKFSPDPDPIGTLAM